MEGDQNREEQELYIRQMDFVICPLCGKGKLIFEDINADGVPIRLIMPGSKRKAKWYVKCNICKRQVGLSLEN